MHQTNLPAKLMPFASQVTNLRLSDGNLVPVGKIKSIPSLAEWKPLCRISDGGIIAIRNGVLALWNDRDTTPMLFAGNTGDIQCALPMDGNKAIIMCANGPFLANSATMTLRAIQSDFPPVHLLAQDASVLSVTVPARKLSTTVDSSLPSKDVADISADLINAYTDLVAQGASAGIAIQPALAFYRLFDAEGNELYTSAPVLLQRSEGTQCDSSFSLYSTDRLTINSYTLSARTWKLAIVLPQQECPQVARMDIFMSPLFHPFNPSLDAPVNVNRAASAQQPLIQLALPGRQYGLSGIYGENARRILAKAIDNAESLCQRVASINAPFGTARTIVPAIAFEADPAADAATIRKVLAAPVRTVAAKDILLRPPHSFTAAAVAHGSGTVAWGGLKALRFRGHSIYNMCAATSGGAWKSTVSIRFADGSGVALSEEASALAPLSLNPVLSYPAPDAVEMHIAVSCQGQWYARTFPLTPDATGRKAIYISSDTLPITLPATDGSGIPELKTTPVNMDSAVLFAPADKPLSPEIWTNACRGNVIALASCKTSDSSWEFGRSRFAAGTSEGVYSLNIGIGRRSVSVKTLLQRGIVRPDALLAIGTAIYAATPGHPLYCTKGTVPLGDISVEALALCHRSGEVWCLSSEGDGLLIAKDAKGYYKRTDTRPLEFFPCGEELFARSDSALLYLDSETPEPVRVSYTVRHIPDSYRAVLPRYMRACFHAPSFNGSVSATACAVAGLPKRLIRSASISGACRGTFLLPLYSRPVRAVECSMDAMVDKDFVFDRFIFSYENGSNIAP